MEIAQQIGKNFNQLLPHHLAPLNLDHFAIRAQDSGDWETDSITEAEFRALLAKKIDSVNLDYVKTDIKRFLSDQRGNGYN